jgi:hypothetical protein
VVAEAAGALAIAGEALGAGTGATGADAAIGMPRTDGIPRTADGLAGDAAGAGECVEIASAVAGRRAGVSRK